MTKLELADKIGRSASAVSQFENGKVRPDGQTVGRLMLALGMPASFFISTSESSPLPLIALDHCHFRSLRSATQRDRRMLLAKGSLVCGLLSFLETKVNLPEDHVTRVASAPRDGAQTEDLAIEVRRQWGLGLGPIGNMINLLERKGVVVIPIDEQCKDVDAFSLWNGRRPCVFLVMEKGRPSRTRMDAAHELGHLVMHADVVAGSPELERQANHFGSAFLMPRDAFIHEAPRRLNWDHVWELKRRWKVSAAAIVRRTYDLGVISEATYRRAFIHLNQIGHRTSEQDEPLPESPVAIQKSLEVIATNWPLPRIADELGLTTIDLRDLVFFAEVPADESVPSDEPSEPVADETENGDLPLFRPR